MSADPYRDAEELADELLDETGSIYDHLRDAIWLYYCAHARLPERQAVIDYVRWCRAEGQWVSGHHGRVEPPRPRETHRHPEGELELAVVRSNRQGDRRGRGKLWVARRVGTGEILGKARSRSKIRRWVEETRPGGEWTGTLAIGDRAPIVRAWGEARDWARRNPGP